MEFLTFIFLTFSVIWIFNLILSKLRARLKPSKLPPGPYQYPIIGNILDIRPKPHVAIAKLTKKYGPLMTLKLGSVTTVVVSTPEIVKLVLQKNDLACSSRHLPSAAKALDHDQFSVVYLPAESQWRKLRKICKEQMFSVPRLDASQGLRREKLQQLCDYVTQCRETGRAVNIGEAAFTTSLNLMWATLFSKDFGKYGSDSSQEMKKAVWRMLELLGKPNYADYFPVLKPFDPQGVLRRMEIYFSEFFAIFDGIVDEKLERRSRGEKNDNDLLEALIDMNQKDETELSRNDIKHLLLDLFVAGTDTTSGTVEWTMTELMRNPDKMSKVKSEITDVIGADEEIKESDISRLPYLQAAVKETLRIHPIGPFLIPHQTKTDVEINDYIIPKDTQIFFSMWADGRDPDMWSNADSFLPERFLGDQIDSEVKDFKLLPFGAGRRVCPGLPLAHRMVHLMVATLVHNFGWELEGGIKPREVDTSEKFGLTLSKAVPLKAIPTKL